MADRSKEIAAIEQALSSGLKQYSVDGQTTTFQSRDELLAELQRLRADDDDSKANGKSRPVRTRFNLGDAW